MIEFFSPLVLGSNSQWMNYKRSDLNSKFDLLLARATFYKAAQIHIYCEKQTDSYKQMSQLRVETAKPRQVNPAVHDFHSNILYSQ